jgi:hypothetical protein
MKGTRTKKGLLVFAFVVLFLPYLQHRFKVIDSGILHGFYSSAGDVDFTWKGWFDGSYQVGISNYYNDQIGFRPDLIRLHGQIDFSLFRKIDFGGTTLGNDNYLFYTNYIDAYYGKDFVGRDILRERMMKLKRVQDTLAKLNKSLILVYAPCKAWYCADLIPYFSRLAKRGQNNYEVNVRIGDSLGINQVDFNSWFLSLRNTTKEILYSRQGIHWTNYGAIIAWDSLVGYLEKTRSIQMPHAKWDKVHHTTEARRPDNDMGNIMNLIFPMAADTFCYPELYYPEDTNLVKPKCIFIGDSYVINLLRTEVIQHTTKGSEFWFYFREVLHDTDCNNAKEFPKITDYDWKSRVDGSDCVILVYTAMNTFFVGDGFIEQAYEHYSGGK